MVKPLLVIRKNVVRVHIYAQTDQKTMVSRHATVDKLKPD